jgi:enoyl-CoA hydratase/carnithine racemase
MSYEGYSCLHTHSDGAVLFVTIDHPPINLLDLALIGDLDRLRKELRDDETVRVAVFQSANPDFFIAHADVRLLQQVAAAPPAPDDVLGPFYEMVEGFRTLPQATIAKIEGRARGGGSEFLLSLDMRFAALGRAVLAQPEVALGIIPGGSGTQRLPRLLGRSRALEIVLGCADFTAEMAERYGYVNRALAPDELSPFVDTLARHIATFPRDAIASAKRAVDAAQSDVEEGLLEEGRCFRRSLSTAEAHRRMSLFMQLGGQTAEAEFSLIEIIDRLGDEPPQP